MSQIIPFGLQQLMQLSDVVFKREVSCFSSQYSISMFGRVTFRLEGWLDMTVLDNNNEQVAEFQRPINCFSSPCVELHMKGRQIATIRLKNFCSSRLVLSDNHDRPMLVIKRPLALHRNSTFHILGAGDIKIGKIKKDWLKYNVQFPMDLDVQYKMAVLAACYYIDITWYTR
ncbi:phospholipid scramblase 1-like [Hyposmocoma kahamanoa]|uniref:phospholipid scramblase 1-like n=1 Tax=Hyposmocoma kahamanoa TaxID=1477025 RepID=UPI000E6D7E0F|nr:phospholipid scramblase 1-like [Hyposmocoma kahamanoa]